MKKIEYNRDIKRKWMLLVICFLALLIIIFGCQSSKLKKIDKEPPVIELYSDTIEITDGDEYSPGDNIKSVKDDIDGDIIKADSNLNETGKEYYFIDSSKLDTSKVGEYSVKVIARDKVGNEVTKEFIVKVNARNDESSSSPSTAGNNSASGSKNNTNNSVKNNKTSNSNNKENISSENNNSETSSNIDNKSEQTCTTVWVQDSAAWDETVADKEAWAERVVVGDVVVCRCGQKFNSYGEWQNHMNYELDLDSHGAYHIEPKYSTVHHDAVTHVVHHEAIGHNEQKCN